MENPRIENEGPLESGESRDVEAQELDDATYEPRALVEQSGSYEQAEAIQETFEQLVEVEQANTRGSNDVSATPINVPNPEAQVAGTPGTGNDVSATPINLPNPVENGGMIGGASQISAADDWEAPNAITSRTTSYGEVSLIPENDDEISTMPIPLPGPGSDVAATPINLPNPVEQTAGTINTGNDVSATPINVPSPEERVTGTTNAGNEVAATPINLPNPVEQTPGTIRTGSDVSATPINVPSPEERVAGTTNAGNEVAATPINLPNPVEEGVAGTPAQQPGRGVEATPINLPNPVEGRMEQGLESGEERLSTQDTRETVLENRNAEIEATPITLPGQNDEIAAVDANELEELPLDNAEQSEGSEGTDEGDIPGLYMHEDKDGNITIVDENGKPIDSPPVVYTYNGKKYITYPGTKPAINEKGEIVNPDGLIELPYFQGATQGLYIHEDQDGNTTVVDEKGNAVDSPPIIFNYQGKNYILYPGMKSPINEKGEIVHPENLIEAPYYKGSTEDLYVHEDKDGKITVVDENGNPVKSPPIVYTYQGKNYILYPGMESPIDEQGTIKHPENMIEAPNYKASTDGLYMHEDQDGNITVVDENGDPVKSPPIVYEYNGKHYFTYPGSESGINPDGSIKNPELLKEVDYYKTTTENMYIHEDQDGNITVVDENGKPVKSPPIVYEYNGKQYLTYPGEKSPIDEQGKLVNPEKLVEAPSYKAPMDGLYMHEDQNGIITVVDKDGKEVDSPPIIYEFNGEYYAGYPGSKPPINPDGSPSGFTDMKKLDYYKPSWWTSK
jgi:uncharacterized protein YrzB (UPF0473 family)